MQEADARGAFAVQLAAVAPPQDVFGVHEGLAVACVAAAHGSFPEAAGELLPGDIAPAHIDIAFVSNLIPHDRLLVARAVIGGVFHVTVEILALQAAMRNPRTGVVVERYAVVDGTHVVVRIFFAEQVCVVLPVLKLLGAHEIVFVCKAPPHVAVGGEARDDVVPVKVVLLAVHGGESPAVVGVHNDDVGLDAALLQFYDAALHAAKMLGVKTCKIPVVAGKIDGIREVFFGEV